MKPIRISNVPWIPILAVTTMMAFSSPCVYAGDTSVDVTSVPPVVAVKTEVAATLQPGIDKYFEVHNLIRDGRQQEAIERGAEAIAFFRSLTEDTDDPEVLRGANYYLAHTYLDVIVDMNTWMRFNGDYEKVRTTLAAFEGEDDYRFVEGKRYALYPASAGGDPETALAMFDGLDERYELRYYKAVALLELGEVDQAANLLADAVNLQPSEKRLLDRLEVERREPVVTSIAFSDGVRTQRSLLDRASRLQNGERLTSDRAAATVSQVEAFPSIASAELEYDFDPQRNEVDVRVNVREGKQRMLGVMAYGAYVPEPDGIAPDTDASAALPLLMYNDQNLFGRMVQLDVVTAGVFWQIGVGVPEVFGSPVSVRTAVDTMVAPLAVLEYRDDSGEPAGGFSVNHGGQAASIGAEVGFGPLAAGVSYRTGFSIFDEGSIATDTDVPRDVRHSFSARLSADTRSDLFFGASREGVALTLRGGFTTFSGYDEWGTPGFRNGAPSGPGTLTYGIEGDIGRRIGSRGDIGVEAGAYGGSNYYTRALYEVSAPGPGSDSALWMRGYPSTVRAKGVAVAHARGGYEIVPGSLHAGVYHDVAIVDVPSWFGSSPGVMNASGVAFSFSLPWSIQMRVAYTHSYHSIDGDTSGGRDVVEVTMMRLTAF